jgi:hypothetical protein
LSKGKIPLNFSTREHNTDWKGKTFIIKASWQSIAEGKKCQNCILNEKKLGLHPQKVLYKRLIPSFNTNENSGEF